MEEKRVADQVNIQRLEGLLAASIPTQAELDTVRNAYDEIQSKLQNIQR